MNIELPNHLQIFDHTMFKKQIKNLHEEKWEKPRKDLTRKVYGKNLLPSKVVVHKASFTKVEPGGRFRKHSDTYHHVFYYFQGTGVGWLGGQKYEITPGTLVQVPAGVSHGYANTGDDEMHLITFNVSSEQQ